MMPVLPSPLPHKIFVYISEEGSFWQDVEVYEPFFEAVVIYTIEEVFKKKNLMTFYDSIKGPGIEVSLLLTHDTEIRKLNAQWRNKDKPTNVLSFPAVPHMITSLEKKLQEHVILFPQDPLCLGDIVLSYETCSVEAAAQNKPFLWHLLHLICHGCLHLLGYTHDTDVDAQEMENLEKQILSTFQVSDPYS